MTTRRAFLKAGGLALFAAGIGGSPLFLNRSALATPTRGVFKRRKTLVCIFQRGAMDGMMAVPKFTDKYLKKARPRLFMPATGENKITDLDGTFGLHPALNPFKQFYDDGRLAIVHGVGSPNSTRSHFDAQDYMETGTPGIKSTSSGWLNRATGLLGHDAVGHNTVTPFQSVAFGTSLPKSMYGSNKALTIADLNSFRLGEQRESNLASSLEALYQQSAQEMLRDAGGESFEAIEMLEKLDLENIPIAAGVEYPRSPLGRNLKQIAQLIKAGAGLEIGFTESAGWDTHVQQANTFARNANDLAKSIEAFWTDLGTFQDDVVLMTMTEFGRKVAENGSNGTDHGRASAMFILGNEVAGGQVYGSVPELAIENLADGRDLPVTTDFRAVFSEVAGRHLNIANNEVLFPGWNGRNLPFFK